MDKYVGKRLDGRYEIMEIIGVGGMAVVYRARDIIDDRIVAVKILKDEFHNNEEFRRRFKTECKAIAVLSHPNIVKIHDVSFGDRLEYIVMEYIEGITLKDYIRQQGSVRWSEVVHFTLQILRALQHAHDKGIIHRDIKSQNIMLLQNGTIKVTDFGIARFNRLEPRENNAGKTIGSVHYISPEQARGDMVDERSDIYSTGIIMYEMLTGKLPFDGSNAVSVAIKQIESEPASPRRFNPSIPEGLEEITLKAIKKNVSQRYQSAAQMISDIDKFKNNPSIRFEYKYFVDETPTKFVNTVPRNTVNNKKKPNKNKTKYVYYDDDEFDEPKRKSLLPLLAGVIAAFLIFGTVCIVFIDELTGIFAQSAESFEMPDLLGMDITRAKEDYRDDLIIKVINQEYSSEYEEDQIIHQSISAGQKVSKLSEVEVVTSIGAKGEKVPDVYGLSKEEAKKAIEDAGFVYHEAFMGNSDIPEGYVIKTDPEKNMAHTQGERVLVYVSSGPISTPVKVPAVIGLDEKGAQQLLTSNGLKYGTSLLKESEAAKGNVIECAPDVGETVEKGSTVTLIVSNGISEGTVDISIPLPANSTSDIYLKIYKNDQLYEQTGALSPSGGTYNAKITGKGEGTVRVTISQSKDIGYKDYRLYSVNFSTGSVTKTNSYNFEQSSV